MFLRAKKRIKDGKVHRYWSIVESYRVDEERVLQRQVLYLGEINDSQHAAWCRAIDVLHEGSDTPEPLALFPDDRPVPALGWATVQIRLAELSLHRPRQWGACWLALELWEQLGLDEYWAVRLPPSRKGTRWLNVLKTLVCYRLIDPGSEWRLQWHGASAMGDLLGEDFALVQTDTLYRSLDQLLAHKNELFRFLEARWQALFGARYQVLLYDLTSTYFECVPPGAGQRQFGYSCDQRSDCLQVVIALIAITLPQPDEPVNAKTFSFRLNRKKLRVARRREGQYLLRSNVSAADPATLWRHYLQLTEVEQAFKELKHDLAVRPIYHQVDNRIEVHIFVAFLAYCLQVTLKQRLRALAPGLTPRAVIEKMAGMQMVDVHLPTSDGRHLVLSRYTQPDRDQALLLQRFHLALPDQPPPKISAPAEAALAAPAPALV